ncbi:Uncharacterized protein SCF082_LOCUS51192 [Durusdinium trenchii]|uniref:Uncharacterized protein n=1 Tax=Durusdinium trenchii TaxID=1381693 RepID=A0ABP0SCY4_9DINO
MCLFSEEVSQNASRADVPESQNVGGGQLELLATLEILLEPTSTAHRDWIYCDEAWCQETVYTSSGEIDWDATYKARQYCRTWDEGCDCNEDWEYKCDSYGYKARHAHGHAHMGTCMCNAALVHHVLLQIDWEDGGM